MSKKKDPVYSYPRPKTLDKKVAQEIKELADEIFGKPEDTNEEVKT